MFLEILAYRVRNNNTLSKLPWSKAKYCLYCERQEKARDGSGRTRRVEENTALETRERQCPACVCTDRKYENKLKSDAWSRNIVCFLDLQDMTGKKDDRQTNVILSVLHTDGINAAGHEELVSPTACGTIRAVLWRSGQGRSGEEDVEPEQWGKHIS